MLKKELRDIFKPTLMRLTLLLILPVLALFQVSAGKIFYFLSVSVFNIIRSNVENIYASGFIFLLGLIILWTANNYGANAFKGEYRDQAFEYLLSFPFSKSRILFYKLAPRVSILFVLTVLYEVLAVIYVVPMRPVQGKLFFLVDPVFFPFWVLFFLMAGFFVGLFEQKNWIAVVTLITFLSTVFTSQGLCKFILRSLEPGIIHKSYFTGLGFLFGTIIILIFLGAAFFLVYRRFDMKSPHLYARKFAFFVLPPLVSLTIVSFYLLIAN